MLEVGDVVYKGVKSEVANADLMCVDEILERIEANSVDLVGEYGDCVLERVDETSKQELRDLLDAWMTKHLSMHVYRVIDVERVVLTDEMFEF